MGKKCLNCEKENIEIADFCKFCGTKLSENYANCDDCWKKGGSEDNCPLLTCVLDD